MNNNDKQFIDLVRFELNQRAAGDNNRNAKGKISQTKLGRAIGCSTSTISLFKNDIYNGDNLKVAKAINDFFRRLDYKEKNKSKNEGITVDTFAVRKIERACKIAHAEGRIVVITGKPGVGKTKGVLHYMKNNSGVIHLKIIPYYSAKNIMSDLHKKVGYNGVGSVIDLFHEIAEKLVDSSQLVLIDEAEYLPHRALELIRRLFDFCDIGLSLVGTPRLIQNLKGVNGENEQLYSRVSMHVTIPDLRHDEDKDSGQRDVEKLVKSKLPDSNGLWKEFAKHVPTPRSLDNLIDQSIKLAKANSSEITPEIIEKAKKSIII